MQQHFIINAGTVEGSFCDKDWVSDGAVRVFGVGRKVRKALGGSKGEIPTV